MKSGKKKYGVWYILGLLPAVVVATGLSLSFAARFTNPSALFFPALAGLSFPVWLLLGGILVILYVLLLRKRSVLLLICIILNYSNIEASLRGQGKPEPPVRNWMAADRFKLLSYNVRLFDFYGEISGNNNRERQSIKQQLLAYIKDQDADIVCLQEYYESKDHSFSVTPFLRGADYRYFTDPAANRNFRYGNVIYAKFPLLRQGSVADLSRFDVVFADLLLGKDTLRIYNIHLESNRFDQTDKAFVEALTAAASSGNEKNYLHGSRRLLGKMKRATSRRSAQVQKILHHAQTSGAPSRIIICGDMNDQPVSYAYGEFRRKGFSDAFVEAGSGFGQSYRGFYPSYRIDYMFFKGRLHPMYFDTRNADYSDHRPLTAVFSLSEKIPE